MSWQLVVYGGPSSLLAPPFRFTYLYTPPPTTRGPHIPNTTPTPPRPNDTPDDSTTTPTVDAPNQPEHIQTQTETPDETNNQTTMIDSPTNNVPTQEPTRNTQGLLSTPLPREHFGSRLQHGLPRPNHLPPPH